MSSVLAARDQTARDPVGAEQYRITQREQQVEGSSRALQTRDTIGQAKGILLSPARTPPPGWSATAEGCPRVVPPHQIGVRPAAHE